RDGGDVARVVEAELRDEPMLVVDREEAGGTAREDDCKALRLPLRRWMPSRDARDSAGRRFRGAVVGRQPCDDADNDERQGARTQPDAPRQRSSARRRGSDCSSAASASSKRQRPRSGSSISFETARTSRAGTPASSAARSTANPSIASTVHPLVPPTLALVP